MKLIMIGCLLAFAGDLLGRRLWLLNVPFKRLREEAAKGNLRLSGFPAALWFTGLGLVIVGLFL